MLQREVMLVERQRIVRDMHAPGNANPVKRTWDFTKRFGIPRFDPRDCAGDPARLAPFHDEYNAGVDRFLAGPTDPKKLGWNGVIT